MTCRQRDNSSVQSKPPIAIETVFIVLHRKSNVCAAQAILFYILISIDRYYLLFDSIFLMLIYCPVVCPPSPQWCPQTVRQCSVSK